MRTMHTLQCPERQFPLKQQRPQVCGIANASCARSLVSRQESHRQHRISTSHPQIIAASHSQRVSTSQPQAMSRMSRAQGRPSLPARARIARVRCMNAPNRGQSSSRRRMRSLRRPSGASLRPLLGNQRAFSPSLSQVEVPPFSTRIGEAGHRARREHRGLQQLHLLVW